MAEGRLVDRLALVTGASRGIGRAVALALAREGAHVIIAARRVGALEELDDEIRGLGGTATLLQIDLTVGEKIDLIGPTIYERWGHLDILVANAGILGPISPLPHITEDAWDSVITTNLTANWRLIRSVDPLLRKSDAGRGVFVSASAAAGKEAYWGPYAVSKAGLETLVKTYARELANTDVRVNIINPGPIRTELRARAFPGEKPESLPRPEDVAPLFVELADPGLTANGQIFTFRHHEP
ncbi:MAG: SDR family NAD(P)-dependent oxidoreductase [Hyphomicrobiaceae bacterium]